MAHIKLTGAIIQASIVGKRIGRMRWSSSSGKTVEGTIAFVVSVVFTACALMLTGCVGEFSVSVSD